MGAIRENMEHLEAGSRPNALVFKNCPITMVNRVKVNRSWNTLGFTNGSKLRSVPRKKGPKKKRVMAPIPLLTTTVASGVIS